MRTYKVCAWQCLPVGVAIALFHQNPVLAEAYIGGNIGGSFGQRINQVSGNEDVNYPAPPLFVYPFTGGNGGAALYRSTDYTPVKLQGTVFGGERIGYYFKKLRWFGVEFENNYSGPNFKHQLATISNPGFSDPINGLGLGQNKITENQLPARARLITFAFNGMLRYKRPEKKLVPYLGFGPAINLFHVTGTGHSGIIVNPPIIADPIGVDGPSIHQTAVRVGLNFKVGLLYQLSPRWGVGAEYHFNWSPIGLGHFRSASQISGDFTANSFSFVLQRSL